MNLKKTESETPRINTHVDVMDGLRGIAIIIVVLFHVWQISWLDHTIKVWKFKLDLNFIPVTGFLGVELFFFISAFCLCYPYAKYMLEGAKFQKLETFIYKRAIKILPSYFLAILLILIFFNPGFKDFNDAFKQVVSHLFFVHNLSPDTYGTINGVFWSLGVEVQFYVIFPFVCFLFRKNPFFVCGLMVAVSVLYRYVIHNYFYNKMDFLLNQLPGFLDMFALGMLAAYLIVLMRSKVKFHLKLTPIFTVFSLVGFVLLIIMLKGLFNIRYEIDGLKLWQSNNRTILAIVFLLIAVASSVSLREWKAVLSNKVLIFMSVISYNLYIWHQLIANRLSKFITSRFPEVDLHNNFYWQVFYTITAIVVGIIVSAGITYIFERPILKKGFISYITHPFKTQKTDTKRF